jgi:hypothetical protein
MPTRARNLGFLVVAGLAGWSVLSPAPAHANVVVTYTTTPHGGNYAPRNVVAAWVEDANGAFVKTISRWSAARTSHLVAWIAKAGANDADAVSGATRQSHAQPVTATWDLKNKAGNEVPDGTYTIRMELADSNSNAAAQNDQGTYTVVKNTSPATQSNVKSGGFTATINYTPSASPTCNNGVVDVGETCDPPGSCPATCAASADACMPNVLVGSAAGCTAACVVQPVTACVAGDGCCPMGCDATTDSDCDAAAGPSGGDGTNVVGGCAAGGGAQLAVGWLVIGLGLLIRRRR